MSERTPVLLLLLVSVCVWTRLPAAETVVVCRVSAACTLPCRFDRGPEVLVHWLKPPEDPRSPVHSFYNDRDQLDRQNEHFRGRTALFPEQLPHGDASLHITGIVPADAGKYKCYASTTRGSNERIVSVDVRAPVSQVSMETDGAMLRCVSNSIVPKPSVSWTEPLQQNQTEVYSDVGEVWSVVSSVPLPSSPPYELSCNVSTAHSWKSATYRRQDPVSGSGSQILSCLDSLSANDTLLWTYNQSQTILNRTGAGLVYVGDWSSRVELRLGSDLVLNGPNRKQGLYSCIVTINQVTYVVSTEVSLGETQAADHTIVIVGVVVGVAVVAAVVVGLVIHCRPKHRRNNRGSQNEKPNGKEEDKNNKVVLLP